MISSKRHPITTHVKTGATKDGKLVAAQYELTCDAGAYGSYGPAVIGRGVGHGADGRVGGRRAVGQLVGICPAFGILIDGSGGGDRHRRRIGCLRRDGQQPAEQAQTQRYAKRMFPDVQLLHAPFSNSFCSGSPGGRGRAAVLSVRRA